MGLVCRRSQIYLLFQNMSVKPCQPFFGKGLLAESVSKDTMVKLTLSQSNLLISLLSRFVELGSTKTHITPQPSVAMSFSTILSLSCMMPWEAAESKHGAEPRLQLWQNTYCKGQEDGAHSGFTHLRFLSEKGNCGVIPHQPGPYSHPCFASFVPH